MAEAFGVAAGVIQVISFGISTAQKLHSFSKGAMNAEKRIGRLGDCVEANTRILARLRDLLHAGTQKSKLNDEFVEDISIAVRNCRNVFEEISDALGDAAGTGFRTPVPLLHKMKWPIFHEPLVKALRQELSECSITLNLILTIHWGCGNPEQHRYNPLLRHVDRRFANAQAVEWTLSLRTLQS